jgi:hypothetical protein
MSQKTGIKREQKRREKQRVRKTKIEKGEKAIKR